MVNSLCSGRCRTASPRDFSLGPRVQQGSERGWLVQAREALIRLDGYPGWSAEWGDAGYPHNVEGESERGGTDLAVTDGCGTAMALSQDSRHSPLFSCSERESSHCDPITVCFACPETTKRRGKSEVAMQRARRMAGEGLVENLSARAKCRTIAPPPPFKIAVSPSTSSIAQLRNS